MGLCRDNIFFIGFTISVYTIQNVVVLKTVLIYFFMFLKNTENAQQQNKLVFRQHYLLSIQKI